MRKGYLNSDGETFDSEVEEAVMAFQKDCGLEQTGMLDDDTLSFLVFSESAAQLDARGTDGRAVWVPTNGGKKRHSKATCSGMDNPRLISVRNAEQLGVEPCKRCNPA